jgi:hypothetical protein
MPLMNEPLDISDWAEGVSSSGTPIVKDNLNRGPKMINDNPEHIEVSPQQQETSSLSSNKNLKGN